MPKVTEQVAESSVALCHVCFSCSVFLSPGQVSLKISVGRGQNGGE